MRQVTHLAPDFFNDGTWWVLTSGSLGGLEPEELESRLTPEDAEHKREMMEQGVCLPLYFDCDCAMDRAVVVVGDLSEAEQAQWVGRVCSQLVIDDGVFLVLGGGMADDFEEAAEAELDDPSERYRKIAVEPGRYRVEVYAFVGSFTVNEHWGYDYQAEERGEPRDHRCQAIAETWARTRPDEEQPAWLEMLLEDGYVDAEESELLEYVIRLVKSDEPVPTPELEETTSWAGVFEWREPELAPLGIRREDVV